MNGHALTASGLAVRGLTVRQPYATLLADGLKTVENRTWNHSHRGDVLIHAASKVHNRYHGGRTVEGLSDRPGIPERCQHDYHSGEPQWCASCLPRSAVVARAILTDVHLAGAIRSGFPDPVRVADLTCGCTIRSGAEPQRPVDMTFPKTPKGGGLFHHVYEDPTLLDQPVPWHAGSLGYWHPTEQLTQAVWEQITRQAESRLA